MGNRPKTLVPESLKFNYKGKAAVQATLSAREREYPKERILKRFRNRSSGK